MGAGHLHLQSFTTSDQYLDDRRQRGDVQALLWDVYHAAASCQICCPWSGLRVGPQQSARVMPLHFCSIPSSGMTMLVAGAFVICICTLRLSCSAVQSTHTEYTLWSACELHYPPTRGCSPCMDCL